MVFVAFDNVAKTDDNLMQEMECLENLDKETERHLQRLGI